MTVRLPRLAPDSIVMLAISSVEDLNVVELTVMPEPNEDVAPLTKPLPLIATDSLPPRSPELGLIDVTFGAASTVKAPDNESAPPSLFVTVTVRAPVLANELIEILAVSSVELTTVVDSTVMLDPEKDALAPLAKPVPLIVIDWPLAPCAREPGLTDSTFGAALTMNAFASEPTPASGLVTATVRGPGLAPESIEIFADSSVEDLNVVELTVMPEPNEGLALLEKPPPLIVIVWSVAPWGFELGLTLVTLGAAVTVKALAEPTPASGFVTVTARVPVAAVPSTVTLAISSLEDLNVVELTVMPAPNDVLAPLAKFLPLIAIVWLLAP